MFIFSIILAIVCVIALVVWRKTKDDTDFAAAGWIGLIAGVLTIVFFLWSMIVTIPAGERGVVIRFNAVTGDILQEGLQFKSPIDKVVWINVQTQLYETPAEAASRDLQDVTTSVAINYKLDPTRVAEIYRTLGLDYIAKIAPPAIQETVKAITARYNAEDMILRREEVKADISRELTVRLAERGIVCEMVNITNFAFSEEFTRAIEAKVVAVQNVLQAQNKLEQIKVEALQAEAAAKGRANAAIAEANGRAEAIRILADAQSKANLIVSPTLNEWILRYIMLTNFGDNIQIWVVSDDTDMVLPQPNP
jgi:regulator of protease activity HflC (stomatin/prohibitin superfamily)